jgi:hypothetical protein
MSVNKDSVKKGDTVWFVREMFPQTCKVESVGKCVTVRLQWSGGEYSTYTERKKFEEVYTDKREAVKACLEERLKERMRLASKTEENERMIRKINEVLESKEKGGKVL